MKSKDILIGFVIIAVAITAVILVKKNTQQKNKIPANSIPTIERKIENTFKGIVLPADGNKIELTDVTNGESFGVVTKTEVLANLPDLKPNENYSVILIKDENLIKLGKMKEAKGGFILEFNSAMYQGYKIRVLNGTKIILEGSL